LTDAAQVDAASCVVELGAGTGAITRTILDRLHPEARLLAFEILPEFLATLRSRFPDANLEIIPRSAACLEEELDRQGIDRVASMVCTLPFLDLPEETSRRILHAVHRRLADDGVLALIQQTPFRLALFRSIFPSVHIARYELRCMPPNLVIVCRRGG
jgi:phospholipid N-methyltransferase